MVTSGTAAGGGGGGQPSVLPSRGFLLNSSVVGPLLWPIADHTFTTAILTLRMVTDECYSPLSLAFIGVRRLVFVVAICVL